MKTILTLTLFFVSILQSFISRADAWDNLTMEEAKQVVSKLEKDPYIFDYCDCCDHSGEYASKAHLLKVTGTEIVVCDWNQEFYTVKITYSVIAELKYTSKGLKTKKLRPYTDDEIGNTVYMNYTWVLNDVSGKAEPLFNSVPYSSYADHRESCKARFAFPTPATVAKVSGDGEYAVWYANRMK